MDTDFAVCLATPLSTSGGSAAMMGLHLINNWRSTHAELSGIVLGTTEVFGIQSDGRDLGLSKTLSMQTDPPAAVGICKRAGIGRVRHLAVMQLWVQEGLRRGRLPIVHSQRWCKRSGRADETPSERCPGQTCGRLVVEETGWTSSHGAEGAVAVEVSSENLVARSATTWLELSSVYTRSLSTPKLAAVVLMLFVMSTAHQTQ